MENFKLSKTKEGHLHFNGLPTGVWIHKMAANAWRLDQPGVPNKTYAIFSKQKYAFQAAVVFIDGMEQKADETARNAAIRALVLCLKTGTTSTMTVTA